jgi:hypothetical protein
VATRTRQLIKTWADAPYLLMSVNDSGLKLWLLRPLYNCKFKN